jgi:hypothetical protein
MIGIGKACVKLSDFDLADAIFVIGQNPGTNHPADADAAAERQGARLQDRRRQPDARDRGPSASRIPQDLLHPLRIPRFVFGKGTQMSDLWLPVGSTATWRSCRE